ncbi:MAG: hypothetical protein M1823_005775 [Watsoniomyces obsoletus]|nr:MAG: hypothetical protein M1823_005775 [Watsoniomyces obsoletus]
MFYSHEILTSRKYGVATVWLVATLGSRSTLKKVNRKAILDVDVPKACQTIVAPEAPMALRLQGNLLYGVSRVYLQQCGYVLADAQQAQTNLMTLRKLIRVSELDPRAGKARPDQLVLPDDPAFLPDLGLLDFNINFALLDPQLTLSLSPKPSPRGRPEEVGRGGRGFVIPTSDAGEVSLPGPEAAAAAPGTDDVFRGREYDEDEGLLPEVDFEFDAEGNIRTVGGSEAVEATPAAARARLESDSAASARVRQEHAEGLRARRHLGDPFHPDDGDTGMDFEYELPEAEPFPTTEGGVQASVTIPAGLSVHHSHVTQAPPAVVETPAPRRLRPPRAIAPDDGTQLRHTQLAEWNNNYVTYMLNVTRSKNNQRRARDAKEKAELWVLGAGIGNVGLGVGMSNLQGALSMFSGNNLLQLLNTVDAPEEPRKRKTPSDEAGTSESERRRVRARQEAEEQVGRGDVAMDEDDAGPGLGLGLEEYDIEIGREARPELQDQSSAMPWNITVSARGSRLGSSVGHGRGPMSAGIPSSAMRPSTLYGAEYHLPSRRVSRITSQSPQVGRGGIPGSAGRMSSLDLGGAGADESALIRDLLPEDPGTLDEFDLPQEAGEESPAGPVTPRTRHGLDQDSFNFLQFVQANLDEAPPTVPDDEEEEEEGEQLPQRRESVIFEDLLIPSQHSRAVAAQGFLHTLLLATRNFITVEQSRPYGEIRMAPVAST